MTEKQIIAVIKCAVHAPIGCFVVPLIGPPWKGGGGGLGSTKGV